jgi:hypothetical protein
VVAAADEVADDAVPVEVDDEAVVELDPHAARTATPSDATTRIAAGVECVGRRDGFC